MAKPPRPVVHTRTREEFLTEIAEQRAHLRHFCERYDGGDRSIAKYLAGVAYVLLYDSGNKNTRPLLREVGVRQKTRYISSSHGIEPYRFPKCPLTMITLEGFIPHCDDPDLPITWAHWLPFDKWWNEPVFQAPSGAHLSRRSLVYYYRTKDGAGHFDPDLDDATYHQFANVDAFEGALQQVEGQAPRKIPHARAATMRQVAWEIEETLKKLDQQGLL